MCDDDINQELKDEINKQIQELKTITTEIHTIYNTPDVDIESIFPELMNLFDNMLVGIKGCKETKKLIRRYSGLFSSKFSEYYKEFQVTESPFSILENFVGDIIMDQKNKDQTNPKTLTELSVIMSTLRKKINHPMMNNPHISKAVNMVENTLLNITNIKETDKPMDPKDIQKELSEVVDFLSNITGEDFIPAEEEQNNNNA